VSYLVRDAYFEPMFGHAAEHALAALATKTRSGRPCLLETHRANFIGKHEPVSKAFEELARLLRMALKMYPGLCFISTEALGQALRARDPHWVDPRLGRRIAMLARRLEQVPRLGRLARLSGIAVLLRLVVRFLGHRG